MLRLWAAFKVSDSVSTAEMLFGSQLVFSGELVAAAEPLLVKSFLDERQDQFPSMTVRPTAQNLPAASALPNWLPDVLLACWHVFARQDASKPPLAPAYDGPFRVIERSLQHRLQMGNWAEVVSTSSLNIGFLPSDTQELSLLFTGGPGCCCCRLLADPGLPRLQQGESHFLQPVDLQGQRPGPTIILAALCAWQTLQLLLQPVDLSVADAAPLSPSCSSSVFSKHLPIFRQI
jgi:hypothetical protein